MKLSPFKTILVFLVLITTGIALMPLLPVKLQPSDTLPSVSVFYSWNSATSRVLEQEVTTPLEGLFSKVHGVKNVSSVSSTGSGNITVEFDKNIDFDAVRFEISTLIRQAYPKFPQGVSYPSITINRPDNESIKPLLSYTLNAPSAPVLIRRYAEDHIKPFLSTLKGIQKVEIYGSTPMEWVMEYDADLLRSQGISPSDIQDALNLYLYKSDAGIGFEHQQRTDTSMINLVLRNYDPKDMDFLKIPVKKIGGRIVYLKDIVKMRRQEKEPDSYYRINGANSITIVIYADALENQLKLSDQVKEKMDEVKTKLPAGYFMLNSYDASAMIRQELTKNLWRSVFTLLILLLFVLAVSRQFCYLLIIVTSLIANLAIAVIFYSLFKIEISFYSFAGIVISLGLMLENSIVMIEHYRRCKNRKVFMAILATTLTTIAALMSVFLLQDRIRINLIDFSVIITINLAVSLVVALFLIPALLEKIPLKNDRKPKRIPRFSVVLTRLYENSIKFTLRFRKTFIFLVILAFGLPLFLLPEEVKSDDLPGSLYNKTLGSCWYVEHLKMPVEKITGGALRLFVQDVFEKSDYNGMEQTVLYVNAELPYGSTIDQMNDLMMSLEKYLLEFPEIEQFQTSINSGQQAQVTIYFKKEYEKTGFPFQLKEQIIRKSVDLGGADWSVYGVGEGFSNSIQESLGNSRIRMFGYNYDELHYLAEKVKDSLLVSPRVKEVTILSQDVWGKDDYSEFVVDLDREKLIAQNGSPSVVYSSLKDYSLDKNYITSLIIDGQLENVSLAPVQSKKMDIWQLERIPNKLGKSFLRMQDVARVKKESGGVDIVKQNQEYCLILAYNYIGTDEMGLHIQHNVLKEVKEYLPLGYTVKGDDFNFYWGNESSKKQYWLLVLVILAIFFICSILFESLTHPLAVITMIPFSYIGLFLTFYFFNLNFDQGGFAAFILLSGLSINSALYLINEYDVLKREYAGRNISPYRLYIKAFNRKKRSVMLSVFAIILGLIPFLFGGAKEVFWPALAGGTIGGLIFSVVGFMLLLPMILLKKDHTKSRTNRKNDTKN
jgi:multidrug efflux pump subunit AcrB